MSRIASFRCATIFAAIAVLTISTTGAKGNIIKNPGFETTYSAVGGLPTGTGYWRGDTSVMTGPVGGVTPFEGDQMLQFITSTAGGPDAVYYASDMLQLVDPMSSGINVASGTAEAIISASFNRVAGDAETDTEFWVDVHAFAGDPSTFRDQWNQTELVILTARIFTDDDPATWQSFKTSLPIPAETGFLALRIAAIENVYNDAFSPEFDGHFADDISIDIVPEPSSLALLAIAALALRRNRSAR